MKKLLLILSAVFVSVSIRGAELDPNTGWDNLNPYAYDLKSEVINNGQTLRLTYKFNAPGFGNGDEYNQLNPKDGTGTGRGIQIYLLYKDADGNFQRVTKDNGEEYRIVTGGYNKAQEWSVEVNVSDIPNNCKGKELTWEARVHGNIGRTTPKVVKASGTKPTNAYGIAVNNDPTHVRFAQMFVSEAYPNKRGGWDKHGSGDVYAKSNTMLEYNPWLNYVCAHHKHYHDGNTSHFASSWANGSVYSYTNSYNNEPNRVKISDDGRMFVSSFHPHASCAVVEYGRNRNSYDDAYKYYSVIKNTWGDNDNLNNINDNNNPFLYRRCIGMDVKGSGDNLKIILLWIDANGSTYQYNSDTRYCAKFEIWEYEVGRAEKEGELYLSPFDTSKGYVRKIGEYTDWDFTGASGGGAFYQGVISTYNNMYRGFADLVYGTNNDVWVKIDYCFWRTSPGKIIRVKLDNGNATKYTLPTNTDASGNGGFYGGNAILVKDDLLFTSSTKNAIKAYQIDVNTGNLVLENSSLKEKYTITDSQIGEWVTGLTMDYAGNLYALARATENGAVCTLNVLGIAMPYKTKTAITTRAKGTFVVNDPIPNILATDLRYDIVRGKNQYEFSFNVNTKPQEAQIRFYESYEDMQKSLNVVNADDFNGTNNNKPVYVYNIPADKLIQGRIAVTLGAVGGQADDGVINNNRLPAGVLYWSVYVKTRKSNVFAPIYRQEGTTIDTGNKDNKGNPIYDYERRHIVVNNYPETDMFGALIVAHNPSVTDDATRANRGLHIYGLNPDGNSNDEQATINNNTRYGKRAEYLNENAEGRLHYPRRLAVGPDGKVYVADEGTATASRTTQGGVIHEHGGVKLWDPANPNKFALFSDNRIGTATGVALYDYNGWKLYANNTYNEFTGHGSSYTKENQDNPSSYGWNGFVGYVLDKYTSGHNGSWSSWGNNATEVALRRGDASGNFAFAAMDKGLWICQYREHTVDIKTSIQQPLADNFEAYILSFVPYGTNVRTWRSSEGIGVKSYSNGTPVWDDNISPYSQTTTAPLQSTPGGGVAYKKTNGKEYVYVVNHDGNIAVLEITGWTGTGVSATPIIPVNNIKILTTPEFTKVDREVPGTSTKWHTAFITSMCFDYAGNLVTTTGKGYHDAHQDILVYTMPYDRVNAREIQAPNSCRMIPERIAQLDMNKEDLDELIEEHQRDHLTGCAIDLYRPLQGGMFNTICLPCTLDLKTLPEGHPLYEAELKEYTGLNLNTVGGEKVLELVFTDVSDKVIIANEPYIIEPKDDYNSIIRFAGPLRLTNTTGEAVNHEENSKNYNITYQGIIPFQNVEPKKDLNTGEILTLMLVADNRLAAMTVAGLMYGFRGYFELNQPLPKGMQTRITTSKGTTTNTTIVVDGKKVNVEKYLQEGRVYIRMGDSLYTVDGQLVK